MPFDVLRNNVGSTLASRHNAASGTLEVKSGEGAFFGSPSPSSPIVVTVARAGTLIRDRIVPTSTYTIFRVTGRTGDTLSGLTAISGTGDRDYARGDPVQMLIVAEHITAAYEAIEAIEEEVATLPVDASVVHKTGNETVAGIKTFSSAIAGSVTGNAATVTNGVYTTGAQTIGGAKTLSAGLTLQAGLDASGPVTLEHDEPVAINTTYPVDPQAYAGLYLAASNTGNEATTHPYFHAYAATTFNGVPIGGGPAVDYKDNVHAEGWKRVAGLFPEFTHNKEQYWVTQHTTESHDNFTSIDGVSNFRTWYYVVTNDLYRLTRLDLGFSYSWFGRLGTFPVLRVQTNDNDGGDVLIQNDGSVPPLQVITTTNNFFFTANADQAIYARTGQAATSGTTTRNGVAFYSQGQYWNGSAAAAVNTGLQTVVTGNNAYHLALTAGLATWRMTSAGKSGAVPLARLTESFVAPSGHVGMATADETATRKLIGLTGSAGSEQVKLDGDGRGIVFGGVVGGSVGATPRGNLDVAGALYLGVAATTHGIVNSADGIFVNADADANASDATIAFGKGRSGFGGGTSYLTLGADGGTTAEFNGPIKFATDNTRDIGASGANRPRHIYAAGNATVAGNGAFSGTLAVGGGTPIASVLSATAPLDFGSVAAQTSADLTISVTGAAVGDSVSLGLPAAPAADTSFSGFVSAADTVTVRFHNYSSGAVDPASGTYRATVTKF